MGQPEVLTTVNFGSDSYTAVEGGAAVSVTVSLSEASVQELTVPITVSEGADTEPGDYLVSSAALTFAVGESSKTFTVTARVDADSADETVELGFGTLPVGVVAGTTATASVALSDNDPLTVQLSGPSGTVDGAFDVTVTFSEAVSGFGAGAVTVSGGTATVVGSGEQYTATVTPSGSGTVTVAVGAGVVQDAAGNGNEPSQQLSVAVQFTCTTGVAVPDPVHDTGLVGDCVALLAAEEQLAGTAVLNWSADLGMDGWDGVTVNPAARRVTELRLGSRALDGTVPAGLSELTALTALDLGDNRLSGRFPGAFENLGVLTELQVHDTRLSGCVPEALRSRLDGALSDLGDLRYCDEGPGRPQRPTVAAATGNALRVSWSEALNTGAPITAYDVRYREVDSERSYSDAGYGGTATETTITGLLPGRTYEVQVMATNRHGPGAWSKPGVGETAPLTVNFGGGQLLGGGGRPRGDGDGASERGVRGGADGADHGERGGGHGVARLHGEQRSGDVRHWRQQQDDNRDSDRRRRQRTGIGGAGLRRITGGGGRRHHDGGDGDAERQRPAESDVDRPRDAGGRSVRCDDHVQRGGDRVRGR